MALFDLEIFQKLTAIQDICVPAWSEILTGFETLKREFLCEKEQEEEILHCSHELP